MNGSVNVHDINALETHAQTINGTTHVTIAALSGFDGLRGRTDLTMFLSPGADLKSMSACLIDLAVELATMAKVG